MLQSFVRAHSRLIRGLAAVALALGAAAAAPAPDIPTGRIEGTVRDQAGAPIANAQLIVVGTSRSALSDSAGRYLIRGIRAGTVSLRASFIGYKSTQVQGVQVASGRTTVQDIVLEASAVQLQEMTVVAAGTPLVPRDEVTTKQRLHGVFTETLPVDRSRGNGFAEASVTTGAASAEFGNARRSVASIAGAPTGAAPAQFNTEDYHRIQDNRFLTARANPLSTFSIDVDAASYSNVRRFLTSGQRPPKDAVRVEELVNYFPYDYAEPRGDEPFSVSTEVTDAPWAPGHRLVLIGLQGRRIAKADLPPSNLVFLIDVSGSMMSPDKLPLVQRAFRLLVEELRPQDRVAIAVYAGAAGLVLPSTPGSEKARILEAIDRLQAGGSTAGGAGLLLAYDVARQHHLAEGNNRVILATDGDFNVGVSSEGELVRLVEERREQGTYLTVLGFGTGNLKDSRMEQLADKGNGHYAYVDDILEARKVFVTELGATLVTIAKDVKIQVEFNPAQIASYRLIGYENRALNREDFADDTKDAGEIGAGHSVTALYEVVPAGREPLALGTRDSLRYQTVQLTGGDRHTGELLTVKLRYKSPAGGPSRLISRAVGTGERGSSENIRFAAAVAAFGMLLRDSEFKGAATYEQVIALAGGARGRDPNGYRAEFLRLAEAARSLPALALSALPD